MPQRRRIVPEEGKGGAIARLTLFEAAKGLTGAANAGLATALSPARRAHAVIVASQATSAVSAPGLVPRAKALIAGAVLTVGPSRCQLHMHVSWAEGGRCMMPLLT